MAAGSLSTRACATAAQLATEKESRQRLGAELDRLRATLTERGVLKQSDPHDPNLLR